MSDKTDKRMAGHYEVVQGIRIGNRGVVLGVDEKAELPYFCAFCEVNGIFESCQEGVAGDGYVEMAELFADRVKEQCGKAREEQEAVTVPRVKITTDMCKPMSQCGGIAGKVMAVKLEVLRPEYRSAENQLIYVRRGNGTREHGTGSACYCTALYFGENQRWERHGFAGGVKRECLPQWAKERAAEIAKEQKGENNKDKEKRWEAR